MGTSKVSFQQFVIGTSFPLAISGILAALILLPFRKRFGYAREFPTTTGSKIPAVYLSIVILSIVFSDLSGLAPYISLGVGFMLGFIFTFQSLKQVLKEFDLRNLLILYGFIGSVTAISILFGSTFRNYAAPTSLSC